ncbi:TBC1 domain family member 13 [Chironomus tepperi]|uniref:TBC1 domain family member 13 n=1 Tax=Chironomus tepperi TaxID=113505 RepID=UPI00391EE969
MSVYKSRLKEFENLINQDEIDKKALKKFIHSGIPECAKYRPICWKLLFNYLDPKRKNWESHLERQRNNYRNLIKDFCIPPSCKDVDLSVDHPLSDNIDSSWSTFFKDNETFLLQIDKDARRLLPDISFFQEPCKYPCDIVVNSDTEIRLHHRVAPSTLSSANVERKGVGIKKINLIVKRAPENYQAMQRGQEANWEVVERMLFIYAKLNSGQGYVQGMNEIIGPIYYVFASNDEHAEFAEADCFWCFTALMSEIRDFFIKTLDETDTGIRGMMNKLTKMLEKKDIHVSNRLKEQGIFPQYYSFRWISLILSQEFDLPDVLRLWDSILADENRFEYLICVCCAMIILVRDQILENDFEHNVKLLQNYPSMDINFVLNRANQLMEST